MGRSRSRRRPARWVAEDYLLVAISGAFAALSIVLVVLALPIDDPVQIVRLETRIVATELDADEPAPSSREETTTVAAAPPLPRDVAIPRPPREVEDSATAPPAPREVAALPPRPIAVDDAASAPLASREEPVALQPSTDVEQPTPPVTTRRAEQVAARELGPSDPALPEHPVVGTADADGVPPPAGVVDQEVAVVGEPAEAPVAPRDEVARRDEIDIAALRPEEGPVADAPTIHRADGEPLAETSAAAPIDALPHEETVALRAPPPVAETPAETADTDGGAAPPPATRVEAFLRKMSALASGTGQAPVTILHIGDSHISSDSFSRGIRRRLQSDFGNAGRGAVIPAGAYRYAYADGVDMSAAGAWRAASSMRTRTGPYGLSGVRLSTASRGAAITLKSKDGPFDWAAVTVLTGPDQGSFTVTTEAGTKTVSAKAPAQGSTTVRVEGRALSLKVAHAGSGTTTVLNWATGRNVPGVRYVSFGLSGATAYITRRWSDALMAHDVSQIDPDLIVFGYGTNEGYDDNLDVGSYKRHLLDLTSKLTRAAPDAAFLFIAPADGARRSGRSGDSCGGGWRTPPKLAAIRAVMRDISRETDSLYWDWQDAMGGRCAVDRWARAQPRLAAGDRVHLTQRGYDASAEQLVGFLEDTVQKRISIASR